MAGVTLAAVIMIFCHRHSVGHKVLELSLASTSLEILRMILRELAASKIRPWAKSLAPVQFDRENERRGTLVSETYPTVSFVGAFRPGLTADHVSGISYCTKSVQGAIWIVGGARSASATSRPCDANPVVIEKGDILTWLAQPSQLA